MSPAPIHHRSLEDCRIRGVGMSDQLDPLEVARILDRFRHQHRQMRAQLEAAEVCLDRSVVGRVHVDEPDHSG